MKKILVLLICSVFLILTFNDAKALSPTIKEINVEKDEDTVSVSLETDGTATLIIYETTNPIQLIIDVVGDGFTDVDENIHIDSGAVKQIKTVKNSSSAEGYYGVDFFAVELTELVDYKFSCFNGTYLLVFANSKGIKLLEEEQAEETKPSLPSVAPEIEPTRPATGIHSEKAVKLRQVAYLYQREGKHKEAIECYKQAIEEDPYYAAPHNDLGVIYYIYLGEVEAAIDEFKKALAIDQTYLGAHTNLALLYEKLGRKEDAIRHLEMRVRLGDPKGYWTELARQRLRYLTR